MSMQELGERVGLSHTPCWRRVKRLEEGGFIRQRVALLDPARLDLTVNVFVNVNLRRHQENALSRFEEAVQDVPEVVECYTVSGETDFLLRVVVADVSAYERLLKEYAGTPAGGRQPDVHVRASPGQVHDRPYPCSPWSNSGRASAMGMNQAAVPGVSIPGAGKEGARRDGNP